jgi:hypothetical protein
MAWFFIGIVGSFKLFMVNGINIYSF